jgi:hypothetical protein
VNNTEEEDLRLDESELSGEPKPQFPIFSYEEYDFSFEHLAWPLGLKSTYPAELIRRVAAAAISYQMGNRSIDYIYKRYLKEHQYGMGDESRLDLQSSRGYARTWIRSQA